MNSSELNTALQGVASSCLARKVRQANRQISGLYDDALRPHNLKVSQFNILVAVGLRGTTDSAELQHLLTLEKSTVSRNVERLLANGWIDSVRKPRERVVRYRLSRKGRSCMERALPDWQAAQQLACERLGAAGVKAVDQLARSLKLGG